MKGKVKKKDKQHEIMLPSHYYKSELQKINEGYQLPEDCMTEQGKIYKKKEYALYKWYENAKPKDDQFVTDVDQWEASQTQHSTFKMGAMDKKEIIYEYECL